VTPLSATPDQVYIFNIYIYIVRGRLWVCLAEFWGVAAEQFQGAVTVTNIFI